MIVGIAVVLLLWVVFAACERCPLIFVYTIHPESCRELPKYIYDSLRQALLTQPESTVMFATNLGECVKTFEPDLRKLHALSKLVVVNTSSLISDRTRRYQQSSSHILSTNTSEGLWITSASRFFLLEDIQRHFNFSSLLHVEADNMLYGPMSSLWSVLASEYPNLAATALSTDRTFITASVLWVPSLDKLVQLNDFLLDLSTSDCLYEKYYNWLGLYHKKRGTNIVKPFAINEMSMLGYYRETMIDGLDLLPLLPPIPYEINKHVVKLGDYAVGGVNIRSRTMTALFDPGSYGQWIGGTPSRKASYRSHSHIVGQAIGVNHCRVEVLCSASVQSSMSSSSGVSMKCLTAPHFACSGSQNWTLLYNLHVHGKRNHQFVSSECDCSKPHPGVPVGPE